MDITEKAEAKMEIKKINGNDKFLMMLIEDIEPDLEYRQPKYHIGFGRLEKIELFNETRDGPRIFTETACVYHPKSSILQLIATFSQKKDKDKDQPFFYLIDIDKPEDYDVVQKVLEIIL